MSYSLSKKFTFASLLAFALPTMTMMVVTSLYTVVDGFFVSHFVSTNALSAINIAYPLINVVIGIGVMLATGGNAIVARKLGEGNPTGARSTFSALMALNLIIGFSISLTGIFFAGPLAHLMGASELLLSDCTAYLRWQLAFAPALMLQMLFQTFFVTEGRPGIGLFLTILAGIVNGVLDYILIVPMKLGITGAAIATTAGYMVPALIGILYFTVSRKSLWWTPFRFSFREACETCLNGSSEMVTNLSSGVITFLFNLVMLRMAGEDGVAAITIIQYSQFLLNALFMGFAMGVAPVISFNYGCGNRTQLRQVFRTSMIFTALSSCLVFFTAEFASSVIVRLFATQDSTVYALACHGFLIFAISFLFSGLNTFSSAFFTALSDGRTSAVISFVRTFVLIAVSLAVLPLILDMDGVWLAIPVAELGAFGLSLYYLKKFRKIYGYAGPV